MTFEQAGSIEFWIVAVATGITIEIVRYFLARFWQSQTARTFTWWHSYSEKKRRESAEFKAKIIHDDNFFKFTILSHSHHTKMGIMNLVIGCTLSVITVIIVATGSNVPVGPLKLSQLFQYAAGFVFLMSVDNLFTALRIYTSVHKAFDKELSAPDTPDPLGPIK